MAEAASGGGPYRNREVRAALVPPPRVVPRRLVLRLLGGGILGPIGWLAMSIGTIVLWVMAGHLDYTVGGPYRRHDGEVTRVERTSISENKRGIYRVEFTFVDDDTGE